MRTRYWVAGAAALVVQVVVTAVLVVNRDRTDVGPEPGRLISATPVLSEYGVRVEQRFGRVVLSDRASYLQAAAPFADTGLRGGIESLAGTSNTGHLLFHQDVGCDTVSGPRLRLDPAGTYLLTFDRREHHRLCYAHAQVVVAFIHP